MLYSALYLVRQWIHISAMLPRRGIRILRSILVLLCVPVHSAMLVSTVDTYFASVYGEFHVFPLRAANANPHGPVCTADHGDSTVAAYFGGRCSCWRVVQILRCCRGEALGAPTVAARREICDFLRPLVSDSHLFSVRVCLWSKRVWIFREMTPGMISELTTPQFDSGYIFGVSLRSLLEEFSSFFNAMLGTTVDTSLRQTTEAGFTDYDAPRAVFLRCPQAPDACHHGRYGPEGM